MARKAVELCDGIAANPRGARGDYEERRVKVAALGGDLDVLSATRASADDMAPFYEAYITRHGGAVFSSQSSFCRAAGREIEEDSGLGRMLERVD